ncbi:RibD family protein [Roseibacillus ishigakijimensis]|uniref:RibD family protein n=1 Tax=Roseibacillus ishigakijimensis TaxID=454146 RepID=A0A934VMS2_9BACT|nr:RibD family protein [Roseibacillus ishigakijimensis]MBK1834260.1 RibD family protein [Roseibacillus ishigakijimensis]
MIRPHISLNFALSADGKIGTSQGGASAFTSQADLEHLWALRQQADAVLVGRGTLQADQMSLTIPDHLGPERQPLRCVISRSGHFDPDHKFFQSEGGDRHLVVTGPSGDFSPFFWEKAGARVHLLSLPDFLSRAKEELGVNRLLCEGGGSLAKTLFELDVVDEIHLTIAAHTLLGGQDSPTLTGVPGEFLPASRRYLLADWTVNEHDELLGTWRRAEEEVALVNEP